jgi:hypothetical protein
MNSTQSVARMSTAQLFAVTAVMEVGVGVALFLAPALVIGVLFVSSEIETAVAIGRLAGAALISLGAACWWARHDDVSTTSRGLVNSLLIYNAAIVGLVLAGSFGARSPLMWALAVVHGAMAIWCVRSLQRWPRPGTTAVSSATTRGSRTGDPRT